MLSHHALDRAGGGRGSDDDARHRAGALAFFAHVVRAQFAAHALYADGIVAPHSAHVNAHNALAAAAQRQRRRR